MPERGKCHEGTQTSPFIVGMFFFSPLYVLSTGFLTNSTCLMQILTRFLRDKDLEIAKILGQ